jgi:hypothetical protein
MPPAIPERLHGGGVAAEGRCELPAGQGYVGVPWLKPVHPRTNDKPAPRSGRCCSVGVQTPSAPADRPAARASGKRPRFALNPDQAERLEMLREVDRHATDIYQDAGQWLRRPNQTTMFAGMPPIALMAQEGREGIEAVLRHLNKMTFSGSVAAKPRRR